MRRDACLFAWRRSLNSRHAPPAYSLGVSSKPGKTAFHTARTPCAAALSASMCSVSGELPGSLLRPRQCVKTVPAGRSSIRRQTGRMRLHRWRAGLRTSHRGPVHIGLGETTRWCRFASARPILEWRTFYERGGFNALSGIVQRTCAPTIDEVQLMLERGLERRTIDEVAKILSRMGNAPSRAQQKSAAFGRAFEE
jgi:hypothetical protein